MHNHSGFAPTSKTRGHELILKMLEEFKNGASEQEAYERVLKISQLDFQKEFFAWTEKEVSTWGYDDKTGENNDALEGRKAKRRSRPTEISGRGEDLGGNRRHSPGR